MANVGNSQYFAENIERELNKLYCGLYNWHHFSESNHQVYSTGHWGCGICAGNKQLKALEQIVAVSEVGGLDIDYFTWGYPKFASALVTLVQFLHETESTVGEVSRILFSYLENSSLEITPFEYLYNSIRKNKVVK